MEDIKLFNHICWGLMVLRCEELTCYAIRTKCAGDDEIEQTCADRLRTIWEIRAEGCAVLMDTCPSLWVTA